MLTFLSGAHRDMEPATALTLLDPKIRHSEGDGDGDDKAEVRSRACACLFWFSPGVRAIAVNHHH
jgi:hypothetical protein